MYRRCCNGSGLADEPTGSVDPVMADRLMQLLIEMNRLGKTVIVATHDHDLVARYPHPIFQLEAGTIDEVAEIAA